MKTRIGILVALRAPNTVGIPITEAIGRLRTVSTDGDIVRTARDLGISFGDYPAKFAP
jgi:6-phosphofructokinase 1